MRNLTQTETQSVNGGTNLSPEMTAEINRLIAEGVLTPQDVQGDKWIPSQLSNVRTIGSLEGNIYSRGSGSRLN